MVFQNPSAALNPVMTVAQQVGLPLYLHYDLSLTERSERVTAMLAKVGLGEDVLAKYPHELSGGQRQRVGIATALVTSPRGPAHVAGGRVGRVDAVHHARFRGAEQGHHALLRA